MNWTYHLPGKLKVSLILTGLMGLILVNNLLERSQTRQLKTAFESIYKDRLIAESYILQLSGEVHSIQDMLESSRTSQETSYQPHLEQINKINLNYLETRLTEEEKLHFEAFECHTKNISWGLKEGKQVENQIDAALSELNILSQIQVKEAKTLVKNTSQIFSSDAAHSQLEIALLIVAALIIQSILFASKTLQPQQNPDSARLN